MSQPPPHPMYRIYPSCGPPTCHWDVENELESLEKQFLEGLNQSLSKCDVSHLEDLTRVFHGKLTKMFKERTKHLANGRDIAQNVTEFENLLHQVVQRYRRGIINGTGIRDAMDLLGDAMEALKRAAKFYTCPIHG